MLSLSAHEVAQAVHGTLHGIDQETASTILVDAATTDSREVTAGTLFLAKPGDTTDGHHFIPQAYRAGSPLMLVEREIRDESGWIYPQIIVDDVVLAMGKLAHHIVSKLRNIGQLTVVGITGSAGKTTTKDLLAEIFATAGQTVAPVGSYNGEVGVPLTVFRADESTRFLVIEMGADHVGNIEYLANMVEPDYGVVLKVGTAHAGEFGGVDNIEKTKGELAEGSTLSLALNDDDYRVRRMIARATVPTLYFGVGSSNHDGGAQERVYADGLHTAENGCPVFNLVFPDGQHFTVHSKLIGEHHVHNLLAAAAVAYQTGIEPTVIAEKLNTVGAVSRWRMERTDRADGISIINDAYNANPESMAAALRSLAQLGRGAQPRRTWAVLGAMLELGELSVEEHDRLGRLAVRMNISKLIAVGDIAKPIYNAAHLEGSWGNEATWVATAEQAFELIRAEAQPGDIILFKSSNGAGLGKLGESVATFEGSLIANSGTEIINAAWLSAGDFINDVNSELVNGSVTAELPSHVSAQEGAS